MTRRMVVYAVKMLTWAIRNNGKPRDVVDTGQIEEVSEFFGEKLVS